MKYLLQQSSGTPAGVPIAIAPGCRAAWHGEAGQRGYPGCRSLWLTLLFSGAVVLIGCDKKTAKGNSSSQQSTNPKPAGQLIVYYSLDEEVAEPIMAAFTRQTGIKISARGDTEAAKTIGLIGRLRAEKQSPLADVFWSGELFYTIALANEGLLAPYTSAATDSWPAEYADKDHRWYAMALRYRVILYNTTRVTAAEAPAKLEDLLNAKWKGRLVMAQPLAGTTSSDVASWFAHYGTTRAREILKGLAANDVQLVAGNSTAAQMVAHGQADVGLADSDDGFAIQRNGHPLGMVVLNQGGDGPLAIPNSVGLVAGAPTRKRRDCLSISCSVALPKRMLAESQQRNMPVNAALAQEFAANRLAEPLKVDWALVASKLSEARAATQEILH